MYLNREKEAEIRVTGAGSISQRGVRLRRKQNSHVAAGRVKEPSYTGKYCFLKS